MVDLVSLPTEFATDLRNFNIGASIIAGVALVFLRIKPYWRTWGTARRIKTMALTLFCFSVAYSTYEILYLGTNYRVALTTTCVLWALIAAVWPKDPLDSGKR